MIDDELAELTKEQLIIVVKAQDNTIKELDTKVNYYKAKENEYFNAYQEATDRHEAFLTNLMRMIVEG